MHHKICAGIIPISQENYKEELMNLERGINELRDLHSKFRIFTLRRHE
jgi:hypothetical protein